MPNYLIYPFKTMRITQTYYGKTSHYPHTIGTPKDYPLDEGCTDTGRDWMYCPCDEVVVKRIYGVGNRGVNTIWLESTSKVVFADGTTDYMTMLATHPNDDDLRIIHDGQKFKHGDKICREGTDGASGNHIHLSVGKGKMKGNGWTQNSKGKYVLTTTGGTMKPEQAFFVDPYFTRIVSSGGLTFKKLPKEKYPKGTYEVTAKLAPVRKGAGTVYDKLKFKQLTPNAQAQILKHNKGNEANGFVKGCKFTASEVLYDGKHYWGSCPSGWVCLEHCKLIQ